MNKMGSGEDAQFVFAKYDYTAQGNQELDMSDLEGKSLQAVRPEPV